MPGAAVKPSLGVEYAMPPDDPVVPSHSPWKSSRLKARAAWTQYPLAAYSLPYTLPWFSRKPHYRQIPPRQCQRNALNNRINGTQRNRVDRARVAVNGIAGRNQRGIAHASIAYIIQVTVGQLQPFRFTKRGNEISGTGVGHGLGLSQLDNRARDRADIERIGLHFDFRALLKVQHLRLRVIRQSVGVDGFRIRRRCVSSQNMPGTPSGTA